MVDGYICNNWSKQLFNGMQLEIAKEECEAKKSIPYWRLYWFGQRYDIFRILVNTGVSFQVYHKIIYIYIYIYIDKYRHKGHLDER